MRLSVLSFGMCIKDTEDDFWMHIDHTDHIVKIDSPDRFAAALTKVYERYGDIDVTVDLNAGFIDRIKFNDERYNTDRQQYLMTQKNDLTCRTNMR